MSGISVIVITLNEEENIRDCLASVEWADEIVIVDAESADRTAEIARQFTPHVFVRPWEGFSASKNFAVAQCHHDWVLWLDADERVTPSLAHEIREAIANGEYDAYEMPRLANFLGRWIYHSGWYPGHVLRLIRRELARFNDAKVHEGLDYHGPRGRLKNHLLHYTDRTLEHYFRKFNRYTSLSAEQLYEQKRPFRLWDLLFRPPYLFFRMYLLKRGFLDGLQGFMLAVLSSAYVFTKYAKLWELHRTRGASAKKKDVVEKALFGR